MVVSTCDNAGIFQSIREVIPLKKRPLLKRAATWPFISIKSKTPEDFHNLVKKEFCEYLEWLKAA